ncbi:MAG TPA: hypothetical protein VE268_05675, partial [Herpetosiphonaceae bacterium]|nr:hypothetical protein [Herpetosiphonaceae bacterium]
VCIHHPALDRVRPTVQRLGESYPARACYNLLVAIDPLTGMRPLFRSPPPPLPMVRDPDRAVLVRKALQDRLIETLRYLEEEIEPRRAGGLGEAQAAGYVAGRFQRAEQQAAVTSFRTGRGPVVATALIVLLMAIVSGGAAVLPLRAGSIGTLWILLVLLAMLAVLFWEEIEGVGLIGRAIGARSSQSVVGVRAAADSNQHARLRVVLAAPLDSAPQSPPRRIFLLGLLVLGVNLIALATLIVTLQPVLRLVLGVGTAILGGTAVILLAWRRLQSPQKEASGSGELAALIAIAEELSELRQVELWTVAFGAVSAGNATIHHIFERYPFGVETCFINLHHMTAGQPVFVTREGLLHERRSDRRLLAVASAADAVDVSINAEPRRVRRRTLAAPLLQRGYRTITITSHPDTSGFVRPDPLTLERCVKLVVGMIRELDQEETTA